MNELKEGDWIKIVDADKNHTLSVLHFKEKRGGEAYIFDTFYNNIEENSPKAWIINDVWLGSELFRRDNQLFHSLNKNELNKFKSKIIKTILEGKITNGSG